MATGQPTVEYREINDFPGYRVGDDGSVWTAWRKVCDGTRGGIRSAVGDTWRPLNPRPKTEGHLFVSLGKCANRAVHRLVLEAFVGPCPPGMEACHNDGSPANNHLPNLRWDTRKANIADCIRHGTRADFRGERHGRAKLTDDAVRAMRAEYATGDTSYKKLAAKFGVSKPAVWHVISRRAWSHVA